MTPASTSGPSPDDSRRGSWPRQLRAALSLALSLAILWLAAAAATAAAAITVSPASAAQGASVTISGNVPVTGTPSCPSSASVQLTSTAGLFPPDGFGPQAARDPNGSFVVTYAIPAATPSGSYNIGIRCAGGNVGVSATLQVTRPVTTTTVLTTTTAAVTTTAAAPTTLPAPPSTVGSASADEQGSVLPWIGLGVVLGVLVTVVAMLAVRRRRVPPGP